MERFIFSLFIIMQLVAMAQGAKYYYMRRQMVTGSVCTYTGYKPGGNEATVKRITAPIAKMQTNVIAQALAAGGKAATFTMHALNGVAQLSKSFTLVPGIGPALGAFGVVFGMFSAASKPTPANILKATNKAIAKLTDEVNDRMDEMKGYVDDKVINLEKSLVNNEYKSLFILWSNCIEEKTPEKINECQRDASKDIVAAKPKFEIHPTSKDDVFDVKRLEASLYAFRDYATLSVLSLNGLVETYKPGAASADDHYYNLYSQKLKDEVKSFETYLKVSMKLILDMHLRGGDGSCDATFKCGPRKSNKNWLGAETYVWSKCGCVFDPADVITRRCETEIKARVDFESPSEYYSEEGFTSPPYSHIKSNKKHAMDAIKDYSKYVLNKLKPRYMKAMKEAIENTWKNEVLDLLPAWKAAAGLEEGEQSDASYQHPRSLDEVEYSKDYQWRKAVANQMAKDFDMYYGKNMY